MLQDHSWISQELGHAQFNDKRLNKRFLKVAYELAEKPDKSIHSASLDWASTKAAYRFFDNENVESSKILEPHFESTKIRCSSYEKIIISQDTSYIDFSKHQKTTGLGNSFQSHGKDIKGICLHSGMAMSEKGLPLGLIYNKLWIRKGNKISEHKRTNLPVQLKESYRWIECIKKAKENLDNENIVVVCDRESDIHEVFEAAIDQGVDIVVRSQHNRILEEDLKMTEKISLLPVKGTHTVHIPGSGSRKAKTVKLDLRFGKILLNNRPSGQVTGKNKNRSEVELFVVDATELGGDLSWRLLTTIPVTKVLEAKKILNYYKMRWNIELYFKTLKTGCNIEKCRLGEAGKLVKYISLMSVIGWRLFWMTFVSRENPNVTCEVALTESEWKTAWFLLNRRKIKSGKIPKKPPDKAPTLREAIRWIAGNGGFLGRNGDGEPGLITFWRGWNEVLVGVEMYDMLN